MKEKEGVKEKVGWNEGVKVKVGWIEGEGRSTKGYVPLCLD